jgi:predicted nucleic acid-binding protein
MRPVDWRSGISCRSTTLSSVAAALQTECSTLFSEDMQDGLLIDERLRVRNPFVPER